jgi:exodeoxyribonuclease V beta subunit
MIDATPLHPLTMPLRGRQVIEASAGTGKTWTLAALYVRLVLGHTPGNDASPQDLGAGLYPPQILVMTFTDAATAELRGRIRERLAQAARFFRHDPACNADDFLRELGAQIAETDWPQAAWRLDMAAQWMDEAAIFTIHGWSKRMLQQHAFDSASLFQQHRVEDGERLQRLAVQDYWRQWFYPLPRTWLGALQGLARTPDELLQALKSQWQPLERSPEATLDVTDDPHTLLQRWQHWHAQVAELEEPARAAWRTHAEVLKPLLAKAMDEDLNGNTYRQAARAGYLAQLDDWAQNGTRDIDNLRRFAWTTLQDKTKAGRQTPPDDHGVFARIDALHQVLSQPPDIQPALLAHAAQAVALSYQRRKQELAQFDFADLLQQLYRALQAPDGRLAATIRAQYPVALVDEFQDTDPWQYGSLSRIYSAEAEATTGLVMIGDPKQAIYGFRGADLQTYLKARAEAQGIHTLSGNFRSTPGVVTAVNHVFQEAKAPFGDVPFEPVVARKAVPPWQVGGQPQPAMTVWHLPGSESVSKSAYQRAMAEVFATQMVRLLQQGAAQPGEMAVLVRDRVEAAAIRRALAARGVRSVYLSERDSVFATPQAQDLWRLLRAVAAPRQTGWVKAALLTRLWGMPWGELEHLAQDEAAWDALVDRFHTWQALWQRQGFLPMLYRLLHDEAIPARLLAQDAQAGERALTNLLHLGDLLQASSLHLQGEGALIRHLEDQLRAPSASGDAAQLRLESDAELVQVITLHKSKGLQYPLVFLPFASAFRGQGDPAGSGQLDEDVRLLYVALTRAERALWVGVAPLAGDFDSPRNPVIKSAVSRLLGRETVGDWLPRLQRWAACPEGHIAVVPAPEPDEQVWAPVVHDTPAFRPAAEPQRLHTRRWWMASFSALTRTLATAPVASGPVSATALPSERDERWGDAQIDNVAAPEVDDLESAPVLLEPRYNPFPAGSAYGTLLHDLLEWQAHQGWPAGQGPHLPEPPEWRPLLERQCRGLGLDAAQQDLLAEWVPAIVRTPWPVAGARSPLVLARLTPDTAWPEMGFTLPVQALAAVTLDRLIGQHIHPGHERPALAPVQLEGMLTGFMDLVLEHEGRYFVLDYKSNRLPRYDETALTQAMLAHRYDVQLTLYTLALHRLLKARLPGYDYDRHVGGALYLFLRGVDQAGAGLYQQRPPRALIEALDGAFAARAWAEPVVQEGA